MLPRLGGLEAAMVWDGARDHDDDRSPGVLSDAVCFVFVMFNAVAWPVLAWLIFAP